MSVPAWKRRKTVDFKAKNEAKQRVILVNVLLTIAKSETIKYKAWIVNVYSVHRQRKAWSRVLLNFPAKK